jgi:hypothetical protein
VLLRDRQTTSCPSFLFFSFLFFSFRSLFFAARFIAGAFRSVLSSLHCWNVLSLSSSSLLILQDDSIGVADWSYDEHMTGKEETENAIFAPFLCQMHNFAKTGSGQT